MKTILQKTTNTNKPASILDPNEVDQIIKEHSKSFSFASSFLTPEKKRGIRALYAFCRYIDDLADKHPEKALTAGAKSAITLLLEAEQDFFSSNPQHPIIRTFKETYTKYSISAQYVKDLIYGCKRDLTQKRYRNFAELSEYCYQVASTVGYMSA
ncbi:MAG TPA: squalene/phytoene synthase family protein, partial [Vampirovibrionales bacterium]